MIVSEVKRRLRRRQRRSPLTPRRRLPCMLMYVAEVKRRLRRPSQKPIQRQLYVPMCVTTSQRRAFRQHPRKMQLHPAHGGLNDSGIDA